MTQYQPYQYNSRALSSQQFSGGWTRHADPDPNRHGNPWATSSDAVPRYDAEAAAETKAAERTQRMGAWDAGAEKAPYTGPQSPSWLRQDTYDSSKW